MPNGHLPDEVKRYSLIDALRLRRSRRFVRGMKSKTGPLAHESPERAVPLTDHEEALLAFAACGVTGPALADLVYTPDGGGTIMAGLLGRTIASGDAINTATIFVINDGGAYLLKRPQDFAPDEIPKLAGKAADGAFTDLYHGSRVKIADHRVEPPLDPIYNINVNRWALYEPSCTYFLPVSDLTLMYINGVLEILGDATGVCILDERAGFRPAGVARFCKSRGGHLHDDPKDQRLATIQQIETLVTEFVALEQGMALQNLALMTQAMGLGGFPHWAAHAFGWLEALGFRMQRFPASKYLGMGPLMSFGARLLGKDTPVPIGVALYREGKPLLVPFCPPHFASMEQAVRAVVDLKFGENGIFRGGARHGAWKAPQNVSASAQPPSEAAIDATISFCEYVFNRYGRFPAYQPPFRTMLGYQVGHVDEGFYDEHYRPDALSDTQREHMRRWHGRS